MKTKEQLAEEYSKNWQGHNIGKRFNAITTFLAGYDARDAELSKLPDFDEKAAENRWSELWKENELHDEDFITRGYHAHEVIIDLARWQFQECAKIIAARDAEIAKLKECLELWTQRNSNLQEKIRELESREISDGQMFNIANKNAKISELEKLLAESNNSVKALNEKIRELENFKKQQEKSDDDCPGYNLHRERLYGDKACEFKNKLQAANSIIDELERAIVRGPTARLQALEKIKQWKDSK